MIRVHICTGRNCRCPQQQGEWHEENEVLRNSLLRHVAQRLSCEPSELAILEAMGHRLEREISRSTGAQP